MARSAIRLPTLRTVGIAGAAAGLLGLVTPFLVRSPPPFATIDTPAADTPVGRCFVAKGRVDPVTIRQPLWLLKAEPGDRWREVGRVYPPPGTWGSRVCVGRDSSAVRLALVLADDELDARLAGPPQEEPEAEFPDWLKPGCHTQQQGGCGRRHGFPGLPAGATLVAAVSVRVVGAVRFGRYLVSKGPTPLWYLQPVPSAPKRRHAAGANRPRVDPRSGADER
jgi:hypothetical protein